METRADETPQHQQEQPYPPSPSGGKKEGMIALAVVIVILVVLVLLMLLLQQPGPGPGTTQAPDLTISNAEATSPTTANVTFGHTTTTPHPVKLKGVLSTSTQSGTYTFPSNLDGVTLFRTSGDDMGTIVYRDFENNEKIDPGDMLLLSDLQDGALHNLTIRWEPNDSLMAFSEFLTPEGPPVGQFAQANPTSNTTATIVFASFSKDVEPMNLMIILQKDGMEGAYTFPGNDDWTNLTLVSGVNVGNITYRDFADNGLVNAGDELRLSELSPATTYTIYVLWYDGSTLDSMIFSTPT
ncbi:MAG: hypothetical protein ACE5IO_06680 [Thermoplasmata archaeon]